MIQFLTPLIGPAIDYFTAREQRKKDISLKKIERLVNSDDALHEWELIQAENSGDSWKDELVLIVLLIPLVMCFIPGMAGFVHQGFAVLAETPEFYQYFLGVAICSSFGIRWTRKGY